MTKSIEDRLDALEAAAHAHAYVENVPCNPDNVKTKELETKMAELRHKQEIEEEAAAKAKKKGNLHGDPIFVVE